MILHANALARLIKNPDADDPFVITPGPDIEALRRDGSASIDLRLGTWFVTLKTARQVELDLGEMPEAGMSRTHYVPFGEKYYLHPRQFVLGITLEWLRLPNTYAAFVIGKSSWGRRGLIIATATGVHPGFIGCLTLELTNVGEMPIAIAPGKAICQLFVHRVEGNEQNPDHSQYVGMRKPRLGKLLHEGQWGGNQSTVSPGVSNPRDSNANA